ncbi:MAG: chemotaxis response regulator protein-glutamate methylesterase [bacterium]|nr:chemotaxis response regulator protein-glutamate methylesterase [bacterium]
MKKIRVMVIDDSQTICATLKAKLNTLDDIEVIATAPDPYEARDLVVTLNPDVIILDIEMPRMDGLTFLKKIMAHFPKPVVILSSLTTEGSETGLQALELGAVEVMSKTDISFSSPEFLQELADKVRGASASILNNVIMIEQAGQGMILAEDLDIENKLIVIGASTGGTEALKVIFSRFPRSMPPILIVQHMPVHFTRPFAERLNAHSKIKVKEAEDGELIRPNQAYLAPGDFHMLMKKKGRESYIVLNQGPKVNYQRPSVDILFKSAAILFREKAIGVLLTGMGRDGAEGLLEMKKAGSVTIAQDKESSVVYGMPEAAVNMGAAAHVLPLKRIHEKIIELIIKNNTL